MKKLILVIIIVLSSLIGMSQTVYTIKRVQYSKKVEIIDPNSVYTGISANSVDSSSKIPIYISKNEKYFYLRRSKSGRIYKTYINFKEFINN